MELLNKRPVLSNTLLILIASVFFATAGNIAFWSKSLPIIFDNASGYGLFGNVLILIAFFVFIIACTNLLFSLFLYGFLVRPLLVVLLLCSAGANYYCYTYGVFIDKEMIENVFETTAQETRALINPGMVLWILLLGVLPSILVYLVRRPRGNRGKATIYRLLSIAITLAVIGVISWPSYRFAAPMVRNNQFVFNKLINPFNYLVGVASYGKMRYNSNRSLEQIALDARRTPNEAGPSGKKSLVILVVGETSRAENFSLNGYPRKTNPLLEQQDIINFRNASSCGTATATSVPCMFSNMPRDDFNKSTANYQENLLDILARTGVNLLWRENDSGCKGVCDRIPTEEILPREPKGSCPEGLCHDINLLDDLEPYIQARTEDTVIVLHANGSHGPSYYQRYAKAQEHFTPACNTSDIQKCDRESLINTYDNTIVNVDYVLNAVIELLKKHSDNFSTAMIYQSDHGESLGENGMYLHGLPYKMAPSQQTHIPMIYWLSVDFMKDQSVDEACMQEKAKTQPVSHDNFFHTVLGAMHVQTAEYQSQLDILQSCRKG